MNIKQISVFLENKAGTMLELTKVLADKQIDMRALSLAETSDFGIVRLIVDDVYSASTVLKDAGFIHSVTSVLGVCIPDEPGGLNKVLQNISASGVNIEYMYAFLGGKDMPHAYMIFHVQDVEEAVVALASKGIACISQEDLTGLEAN